MMMMIIEWYAVAVYRSIMIHGHVTVHHCKLSWLMSDIFSRGIHHIRMSHSLPCIICIMLKTCQLQTEVLGRGVTGGRTSSCPRGQTSPDNCPLVHTPKRSDSACNSIRFYTCRFNRCSDGCSNGCVMPRSVCQARVKVGVGPITVVYRSL